MKKKLATVAIQAALYSACFAAPVFANNAVDDVSKNNVEQSATQTQQAKEENDIEKVVVTGSRLRRNEFSLPTPMMTLDAVDIEDGGLNSLQEVLLDAIPSLNEGSSNTNTQSSVQNSGLSTVNLRRLGTDRTLTLIDGRRAVSNSYSGNYISLSSIPSGLIETTEVISGGASAVYGSDAIAGVVNIVTKSDEEGFSFDAKYGEASEGGAEQFNFKTHYGTEFNDGAGYFIVAADFERDFGLKFTDRDRSMVLADHDYDSKKMCNVMNTAFGNQCMRDITMADWSNLSDGTLGGVFLEGSGGRGGFYYTEAGMQENWVEEQHGFFYEQYSNLKTPDDAVSAAIKITHELTDSAEMEFQVQFNRRSNVLAKSPEDEYENASALVLDEAGNMSTVTPGRIPINNPFVPQEIFDTANGSDINWDRRFAEVGEVTTDNERDTLRTWLGFKGDIFDGSWDWDLTFGYGKFTQTQGRLNELNTLRVRQALDAEYAEDGVTIQCADPDARAAGCVPLNLFGIGSITPDMADWVRADLEINTEIEQYDVLGYMAGDLFELPAGQVAAVFGFEYRKDIQKLHTSEEQRLGGVTFNVVPSFEGELEVKELFAEFGIPLLSNVPFAKTLYLETSLRVADYEIDAIGTVPSYRYGLNWQPVEDLTMRANWARAQRAPNVTELLSPPRGDFDSFDDICDGVTRDSTLPGHDNCRLDPTIAPLLAASSGFELEDDNNGYSPNAGNIELFEETSDTFTLGLVYTPEWIDNLSISVDYFDIVVENAIQSMPNEQILSECYASSQGLEGNEFCDLITRDEDGQIIEIIQKEYNIDNVSTDGYDVVARYKYSTDGFGKFYFKLYYTHVNSYEESVQGIDGVEVTDYVGSLSSGVFEDKASASVTWSYDGWRVSWSTKYKGEMIDDPSRMEEYQEWVDANNVLLADDDPSTGVANPEPLAYYNWDAYISHNLSVSKTIDFGDADVRFYGGIRNVFDDKGPFVPDGDIVEDGKGNYHYQYGAGVGQYYYLGARVRF